MKESKRYNLIKHDIDMVRRIQDMGYNYYVSVIFANRIPNINNLTNEEIKLWLDNNINHVPYEEHLLPNLNQALDLFKTLKNKEGMKHILIVSDFDCDGINSAVVAYKTLKKILTLPDPYQVSCIVNKRVHGTGYNNTLINRILDCHKNCPVDILISFDHGSTDESAYQQLKQEMQHTKLIITDHHLPHLDNMPKSADVFINPHIAGETNDSMNISGCAVGFFTLLYIYQHLNNLTFRQAILDFKEVISNVGISTISDVMPLNNVYNRYLAKLGLNQMNSFKDPIWRDMRDYLNIDMKYSYKDISHKIAPLVNTGNRVSIEQTVFELLIEEDTTERFRLLELIVKGNERRKNEVNVIVEQLVKTIDPEEAKKGLCLFIDAIASINGIIAANIGERYNTPTVCFNLNNDYEVLSGSLRASIEGFNIVELLKAIEQDDPEILVGYGGHTGAGGCSVKRDHLERFKELFQKHCAILLSQMEDIGILDIDLEIDSSLVDENLYESLNVGAPYGKEWREALIKSTFKVLDIKPGPKRLQLLVSTRDNRKYKVFYFYKTDRDLLVKKLKEGINIDIIYTIDRVSYMPGHLLILAKQLILEGI